MDLLAGLALFTIHLSFALRLLELHIWTARPEYRRLIKMLGQHTGVTDLAKERRLSCFAYRCNLDEFLKYTYAVSGRDRGLKAGERTAFLLHTHES